MSSQVMPQSLDAIAGRELVLAVALDDVGAVIEVAGEEAPVLRRPVDGGAADTLSGD